MPGMGRIGKHRSETESLAQEYSHLRGLDDSLFTFLKYFIYPPDLLARVESCLVSWKVERSLLFMHRLVAFTCQSTKYVYGL